MDIHLDPDSAIARTAADDVRALLTARLGDRADSHQTWNAETTRVIRSLTDRLVDRINAGDGQEACEYAGTWAMYYLGASSLLSEQLLRYAIGHGYVVGGGDPEDEEAGMSYFNQWHDKIVSDVFRMLIEEGRTLV
jgi:hypothetical protein